MSTTENTAGHSGEVRRRDFLYVATGAAGAVGAAIAAWPLVDQMNPAANVLAQSATEVPVGDIQPGQIVTVMWRKTPVFIRRRTATELAEERAVPLNDLKDPQTDQSRVIEGHDDLLVVMGVCTHLGCVPVGKRGEFGGWFCPCHGSHYDASGRIRKGPAPENLPVPPYEFLNDTTIRIG